MLNARSRRQQVVLMVVLSVCAIPLSNSHLSSMKKMDPGLITTHHYLYSILRRLQQQKSTPSRPIPARKLTALEPVRGNCSRAICKQRRDGLGGRRGTCTMESLARIGRPKLE